MSKFSASRYTINPQAPLCYMYKYRTIRPNDADFDADSISILSPVGDAILDLAVGDKSSVTIPCGKFDFEVIDIDKSKIQ